VGVAVDFDGEGHGIVSFPPVVITRRAEWRFEVLKKPISHHWLLAAESADSFVREKLGLGALDTQSCTFASMLHVRRSSCYQECL
jgi:hypothetical protein